MISLDCCCTVLVQILNLVVPVVLCNLTFDSSDSGGNQGLARKEGRRAKLEIKRCTSNSLVLGVRNASNACGDKDSNFLACAGRRQSCVGGATPDHDD